MDEVEEKVEEEAEDNSSFGQWFSMQNLYSRCRQTNREHKCFALEPCC
jgi:hypothetical protein